MSADWHIHFYAPEKVILMMDEYGKKFSVVSDIDKCMVA